MPISPIWPAATAVNADGAITFHGRTAESLLDEFGSPLYLIDTDEVVARARHFVRAAAEAFNTSTTHVSFAGKAFLSKEIVRLVTEAGMFVDTCTMGEMKIALAAGVPGRRLVLHGNNKSDEEIALAIEQGFAKIVIDEPDEPERVAAIARKLGKRARVMLRVTVGVHAGGHEYISTAHEDQKFGVPLLAAGAGLVVYSGLRQYFVGFAETREFARRQYEEGILISEILRIKLEDDRVFATFASCNVLAGYLVLVIPPVCYTLWRFGDRFEPEKVSRPLLAGIGAVFLSAVLLLTRGRGALLAAVLAAAGFVLTLPMRRLWRAGLIALAVFTIAGGAVFAHCAGRGFGSVAERVDYLKTSFTMVMEKPLAGHGWGGFFYRHMQLKTTGTDEAAHDPHNIVAAFATQAGIPAGLLVAFALLYPLAALGRRIFRKEADGFAVAIFWGEVAFLLHALMDVDLQIPACMALAGGLLIVALVVPRTADDAASAVGSKKRLLWLLPGVLLGVAALGGSWYTLRAELAYDGLMKYLQPQTPGDLELRVTPEKIERALRDAVAARPYSPFPWESAGDFYLMRRDYRSAERCFAEAQKRTMARPSTYERLSRIERVRGNRRRAGELLLEACRRFPGNPKYTDELKEHYPELEFNRK